MLNQAFHLEPFYGFLEIFVGAQLKLTIDQKRNRISPKIQRNIDQKKERKEVKIINS